MSLVLALYRTICKAILAHAITQTKRRSCVVLLILVFFALSRVFSSAIGFNFRREVPAVISSSVYLSSEFKIDTSHLLGVLIARVLFSLAFSSARSDCLNIYIKKLDGGCTLLNRLQSSPLA